MHAMSSSQQVDVTSAGVALRNALDDAGRDLVDRRSLVDLIALAAVAGEHLLVIGPPGTAKSQAVRNVAGVLGGEYFEYLLSRFTEPSEIFGPVDLRKLRDGVVETHTAGMLPEAHVAFLDEIFLGSSAILNTLLGLLNERRFRRGSTNVDVPLRVCVGAANALTAEESLLAFADRFLLRHFVDSVADPMLETLLEVGARADRPQTMRTVSLSMLDALVVAARTADQSGVRPLLADAVRKLRAAGISLSDRRIVKLQKLAAAAAVIDGRAVPDGRDLWPIVYALPTADVQDLGRDVLRDLLDGAKNLTLVSAAEEASHGRAVRAQRLVTAIQALLAKEVAESERAAWHHKLEALAREVDAGFEADALPEDLRAERARLVSAIEDARRN